jgi:hypothetical protein
VHVEGVARDAGDYRVGKGWAPEGEATRKVPGSFNRTDTGSVGLSWVGERGYLGAAYTRQTAKYGLPGHNHSFEGCHTHGNHLHCGAHAAKTTATTTKITTMATCPWWTCAASALTCAASCATPSQASRPCACARA